MVKDEEEILTKLSITDALSYQPVSTSMPGQTTKRNLKYIDRLNEVSRCPQRANLHHRDPFLQAAALAHG